jgi:hypothetical protein
MKTPLVSPRLLHRWGLAQTLPLWYSVKSMRPFSLSVSLSSFGWGEWHLSGFFTVRAIKSCPFLRFLFVLYPHVLGHFKILSDFFTKSYTICTNVTVSVFYSTKCIIWEILHRLTPRSARRDHTSASYGRSNSTVITISTLNWLAMPEEGCGRGGSLRLCTTDFHPCFIQ